MTTLVSRIWRWSPLVTLPIAALFLIWARGTYERWHTFRVEQASPDELTLERCGRLEANRLARHVTIALTQPKRATAVARSGLRTIELFVPEASISRLDADLPASGREYVEGSMVYDGDVREVDVRYRGDTVYHWGYWKKSWRVKTKKKALFEGMRRFNLIAPRTPEQLNNYLGYRLASYLDLMAPKAELCNVLLNGRLLGMYVLTEQLDESTLRRHRRMPGDLYSGELIGRDVYLGARAELFDHPGAWSKVAENNHFDLDADAPLRALLHHVQRAQDPTARRAVVDLVDIDAFARFSAFEALACSIHSDSIHNWRLYYDPWKTRFEPVVWDPMGWYWTNRPRPGVALRTDVITSPLHTALFRDAGFLRARLHAFDRFFGEGRDAEFLAEAEAAVAALGRAVALDPNLVATGEWVSPGRARAESEQLLDDIRDLFSQLRQAIGPEAGAEVRHARAASGALVIEVRGRLAVRELRLRFDRPVDPPTGATVRWSTREGDCATDVGGALATGDDGCTISLGLLAGHRLSITSLEPEVSRQNGLFIDPARYELELDGVDPARVTAIEWRPTTSAAWRPVPSTTEALDLEPIGELTHAIAGGPLTEALVWSGERTIEEDLVVERDLVIEPGTRLRIGPGVGVYVHGRLTAVGRADAPIVVEPIRRAGSREPWGTLALVGRGADGSRLAHCHLRFGSGTIAPLEEYSAMLSIHEVEGVRVDDCVFEDSQRVDDMVHAVYSDLAFDRCTFRRSLFDALDVDISRVTVTDCLFEDSGNDALDLMSTTATVTGSRLVASGDKGISVGEDSRLAALDCLFERCAIAVQSKDRSQATLVHCDIVDCTSGVDAYRKNWRYGDGGRIVLSKSRLTGCDVAAGADKQSSVVLFDVQVDEEARESLANAKRKRVRLEAVDEASARAARPEAWLPDGAVPDEVFSHVWSRIDLARRGRPKRP